MRKIVLSGVLSVLLLGCTEQQGSSAVTTSNPNAGKVIAKANCAGCHGMDGRGITGDIPNLAAQVETYLSTSLHAYKEGKRTHAALRDMAMKMNDADMRNIAAYYASLPP